MMTEERLQEIERVLLETPEHLMDTEEATIQECIQEIRRLRRQLDTAPAKFARAQEGSKEEISEDERVLLNEASK